MNAIPIKEINKLTERLKAYKRFALKHSRGYTGEYFGGKVDAYEMIIDDLTDLCDKYQKEEKNAR